MTSYEKIAAVAHEANRAYCASIGDLSQPAWEDAPDWQKESAIDGVCHTLDNPESGPEDSHKNWLAGKEADGWVYGAVKDPENKLHPCMVEYAALPFNQKIKDSLFQAVVLSLAPLALPVEPV